MFTVSVVMFLPFIQMRREQTLNIASSQCCSSASLKALTTYVHSKCGNVPTFHTDEEGTDSEHTFHTDEEGTDSEHG